MNYKKIFIYVFLIILISETFLYFYKKDKEYQKENVLLAFLEMNQIIKYSNVIFEETNNYIFLDSFIDFIEKKTVNEVSSKINTTKYTFNKLNINDSNYCNLSVDLLNKAIICEVKMDSYMNEKLSFFQIKKNKWNCFYSGNIKNKPADCKENLILNNELVNKNTIN